MEKVTSSEIPQNGAPPRANSPSRLSLPNVKLGFLAEDSQHNITFANPPLCEFFGIQDPPSSLLGQKSNALFEKIDRLFTKEGGFLAYTRRLLAQKTTVLGEIFPTQDGRIFGMTFIPLGGNAQESHSLWLFRDVTQESYAESDLKRTLELLEAVTHVQSEFIRNVEPRSLFDGLLAQLLEVTDSEYGFIGEVLYTSEDKPYLKTHAISNIAWNEETRKFYEDNVRKGLEFYNEKTLFGAVMATKQVVIAEQPATDPRRGGLPPGHPALHRFLGVPIFHGDHLIGMFGIANRPQGYNEELVSFLEPLITTYASIILGIRNNQKREAAEKESSLTKQREHALFRSMLDAALIFNLEGEILEFNPAAEKMFGYERDKILGKKAIEVLVPPNVTELHASEIKGYLESRDSRYLGRIVEITAARADGSVFPAELSMFELPSSESPLFTATLRDITERKKVERTLQEAKESAESADRAKSEFLAKMSHEIRTPMHLILGMNELAMDYTTSSEQQELLNSVQSNAESLLAVINEILDFSKIEAGEVVMLREPFHLIDMLENVLESLSPRAHDKGLEIYCCIDPATPSHVLGDAQLLRRILLNLLGNALKFTQEGSILMEAKPQPHDGTDTRILISISDTGIGIPEATQNKIFERFYQVDSSNSRKYEGTGLGLSISKTLCELMDGRIWVESTLGQGSTFFLDLPLQTAESPDITQPTSPPPQILLLTEDERLARCARLVCQGIQIPFFSSHPKQSVPQLLKQHAITHIWVDDRLPSSSIHSIMGWWKEYRPSPQSPFFLLTQQKTGEENIFFDRNLLEVLPRPITRRKVTTVLQKKWSPPQSANPREELPLRGHQILLVEDNPESARFATHVLERAGAKITVASSGREGLQHFYEALFSLIIADIEMPDINGLEMAEKIREYEATEQITRSTPMIALTAHAMVGFREKCLRAGIDDYLTKPIDRQSLVKAVKLWSRPIHAKHSVLLAEKQTYLDFSKLEGIAKPCLVDADLVQYVPEFLHRNQEALRKMQKAYAENKLRIIQQISHDLIGTGSSYGFRTITILGALLNEAAKTNNLEQIFDCLGTLERFLKEVRWQPLSQTTKK
ncbi:MAG: PAS domain S-box protein [Myxococcales bacterium]|nr:PAS domain S-box protein [Myxococcales bacterium]